MKHPRLMTAVLAATAIQLWTSVPSAHGQGKEMPSTSEYLSAIESQGIGGSCSAELIQRLTIAASAVNRLASDEKKVSGGVDFAYDTSTSDDLNVQVGPNTETTSGPTITNLTTAINLEYGIYPGQLEVNSAVRVQLQNGELTENVSAASMSYDHYLMPSVEAFTFIDRYADEFLSIDQRYEIGGGFEFESEWPFGSKLTKTGATTLREIMAGTTYKELESDYRGYAGAKSSPLVTNNMEALRHCFGAVAENELAKRKIKNPAAEQNRDSLSGSYEYFLNQFRGEIEDAKARIRKRYSKFRVGLIVGGFVELEQAKLTVDVVDSLEVELRPPATEAFRFEARPMIMYRPLDGVSLRVDWFLKLNPFPNSDYDALPSAFEVQKWDLRHSINARIRWSVSPFSVSLQYLYLNDSRPPFVGMATARNPDTGLEVDVGPIMARRTRQLWLLKFGFRFP